MFSFVDSRLLLLIAATVSLTKGQYFPPRPCTQHGVMYKDQDVWKPRLCQICVCDDGKIICDDIICDDKLRCPNAWIPFRECCPICPDNDTSPVYTGNDGVDGPCGNTGRRGDGGGLQIRFPKYDSLWNSHF